MSTMPVALSLFAPSSDSMHPGKQQPRCQAVSSSQNRLQFARIDGQTDLDKNLTQSERATMFVEIVQSVQWSGGF